MKFIPTFFILMGMLKFFDLAASHHHHDHNNPPCNHESLEEARERADREHNHH